MKNFEFKSQVATNLEQSKRLLALGLKADTADMMYITSEVDGLGKPLPEEYRYYRLEIGDYHKPVGKGMLHIPAWSLHRLMEMLYADIGECMIFFPNTYEEIIGDIEILIHRGTFNQDYLEEKK